MKKVEDAVRKETLYIAVWTVILSVLMQAVFLIIGKWEWTVLTGNLLGGTAAVLNFFLLGLSVQAAVSKEEKDAKSVMKFSQSMRTLMLVVIAVIGAVVPVFNIYSVVIPLLFPRVSLLFRTRFK